MVNKSLFVTSRGATVSPTDTVNEAGGGAYALSPKHALAQIAATGTLGDAYYANAETQLASILDIAAKCPPEYVAKAAVYARQRAFTKDLPALLLAWLYVKGHGSAATAVFPQILDNGKMLRNVVQIIRSGALGRKSIPRPARRQIAAWLEGRSPAALFRDSVGDEPRLVDIFKMVHPKPKDADRAALVSYLLGKEPKAGTLPEVIGQYEAFKREPAGDVPDVPMEMLTALPLKPGHWLTLALRGGWHFVRMNLATFARHDVYKIKGATEKIAARLKDADLIRRARLWPYQILTTYMAVKDNADVPQAVRSALHDALDVAVAVLPPIPDKTFVAVDLSGSMDSPVTGVRKGATTEATCRSVAGLCAASMLKRNPSVTVIPFANQAFPVRGVEPRDSVLTNAGRIMSLGSGGTNMGAAFDALPKGKGDIDAFVVFSDNQSWADYHGLAGQTDAWGRPLNQGVKGASATIWADRKNRNPNARLVLVDLQPYTSTQVPEARDVLNVGGFSDAVWQIIAGFLAGESRDFVAAVEAVAL